MPTYAYSCDACGNPHEEWRNLNADHPLRCPTCGEPFGRVFHQEFMGSRVTGIVYDCPTTFGQQAEINARRLGKERLALLAEEANTPAPWTGPVPEGAKLAQPTPAGNRKKALDLNKIRDVRHYIETGETT